MFRHALQLAQHFTLPVIISRRQANGKSSSHIASFIILNDEGWILTAHHVVKLIYGFANEVAISTEFSKRKAEIDANTESTKVQRKRQLQAIGRPPKNHTTNLSVWWGHTKWTTNSFECNPMADLAVGQLAPFDGDLVAQYPTLKDPTRDFLPGTNLCKLGFPFHSITPDFDHETQTFNLPEGSLPVPLFPIEGIFARTVQVDAPQADRPWPIKFVETSSPGLMGQSGGPTFDVQGRIWAMQSRTSHHPMGFSPNAPGKKTKEHQFLNVGLGVHAETIIAFLDSLGVEYTISDD